MPAQPHEALRRGWQRLNDGLKQPYPYGELDEQRPKAADGVDAVRLVQRHSLAREPLAVFGVLLLNPLELRLKIGHLLHLAALPNRQRDEHGTHNQREGDDSQAKVQEEHAVKQHEAVYHRLDDNEIPNVYEYLQIPALSLNSYSAFPPHI